MELTVKELIEKLRKIKNQDAVITIIGNKPDPENEEFDIHYDKLELWEDDENTITLFNN